MRTKVFSGIIMRGCILVAILMMLPVPFSTAKALGAQKFVLKAVTAWPKHTSMVEMGFNDWEARVKEKVKERYPGQLEIRYVGGPEAIGQFDQAASLKAGVVDVVMQAPSYCESIVPEAGAIKYSELTPMEDRKTGAYDFWNKIFNKKLNAVYLGRHGRDTTFHFFLNKKVTKPDFSGLTLRTPPGVFSSLAKALGASPITMPTGDVFTALQRGVINGYLTVYLAPPDLGWHEVTKYVTVPGFFTDPLIVLVNLNAWNKLPAHLQQLLMEASIESEINAWKLSKVQTERVRKKYEKVGLRTIDFAPPDAKRYIDTAYRIAWDDCKNKFPELVPRLRKLLSK